MTYLQDRVKGVVLAGGTGSRLFPVTLGACKQLLPVYDKPMIYYPLSVLMLAGIRDILIITTAQDEAAFRRLLGNGERFGVSFSYEVQQEPKGVAQALLIAQSFIQNQSVCLVLGDNLFYGQGFSAMLQKAVTQVQTKQGATIFTYPVHDVSHFGSVRLNTDGDVCEIVEKPPQPYAGLAITGLYFLDSKSVDLASKITPSARGELEITDVLNKYLESQAIYVQRLGRGFTWLDMGTNDALLDAAHFVQTLEKRQGFKVACLEEIAWHQGWLEQDGLKAQIKRLSGSMYSAYLAQLLQTRPRQAYKHEDQ